MACSGSAILVAHAGAGQKEDDEEQVVPASGKGQQQWFRQVLQGRGAQEQRQGRQQGHGSRAVGEAAQHGIDEEHAGAGHGHACPHGEQFNVPGRAGERVRIRGRECQMRVVAVIGSAVEHGHAEQQKDKPLQNLAPRAQQPGNAPKARCIQQACQGARIAPQYKPFRGNPGHGRGQPQRRKVSGPAAPVKQHVARVHKCGPKGAKAKKHGAGAWRDHCHSAHLKAQAALHAHHERLAGTF